jgi:hypothetical protein
MTGWPYYVTVALFVCAAVSWCVAVVPYIRIVVELARARRAGEAEHIPLPAFGRGLPLAVFFTRNILPNVETERQWLVRATGVFIVSCALMGGVIFLFGPHPT